jgi:GNAT superfamily N-acetyltransferase
MPPTASPYEIRPGTDADIPAVIELMRVALGEGKIPRTRDFWTWKHRENPFGSSPMWLALAGDRVVGVRLFMRWSWQWAGGSQVVRAVRAVDTATHPDWQGKGIFKRLTLALVDDETRDGTSFVFNTPNDKSRPGYLKMGWQQVGRLSLWVKLHRPLSAAHALLRARRAPVDTTEPAVPHADVSAARTLLEAASSAQLFERVRVRTPRYATPLSATYLDWRYLRCPAARYEIASTDPEKALIVHRARQRHGLRELTLTDVVVEPSVAGFRAAVASVRQALAQTRPDYAVAALRFDAPEAAVMIACGFVPAPQSGPILTARELRPSSSAPTPFSPLSFHASIGDLELF